MYIAETAPAVNIQSLPALFFRLARQKNVKVLIDAACSGNKAAAKIALQQIRAKGAKLLDTQTFLSSSALHLARKQSYSSF